MARYKTLVRAAVLCSAIFPFLAACSGGGADAGGASLGASTAALQGTIMEVDGQTIDRNGIEIRIVETGDFVMTQRDGSFQFPSLAPGWYTLDFEQS